MIKKTKEKKPPGIAAWLLRKVSPPGERVSIVGDYEEIYRSMAISSSRKAARLWYWAQTIGFVPQFLVTNIFGSISMIKNYLKLATRNMIRNKKYALLNILGLAVGLASCLLIAGYVFHELSFESMYPLKNRIFRVNGRIPMGSRVLHNAEVAGPFGPAAEESVPEVKRSVRVLRRYQVPVQIEDREFREEKMFFAEQAMLEVFDIPFVRGIRASALETPFTVVIDERLARKYFGDNNPLGQIIRLNIGRAYDFQVTGVYKNMPSNTVLQSPMIASFSTLLETHGEAITRWVGWGSVTTFFLLREGSDSKNVNAKITDLALSYLSEEEQDVSFYLQPLDSIYMGLAGANMNNDLGSSGSITRIYIFSGIALLILVVAAINFINLSTAKIAGRMKEVGIRKTCGADRAHLIRQFLMESVFITSISMGLGLLLFWFFKPRLDLFLGQSINMNVFSSSWVFPGLAGMVLVVGLLAGAYPAFFLSRFSAASIFRSGIPQGGSKSSLRRVLVCIQFFIATALMICTLVVRKQVRYSESKDLGFDHKNLVVLSLRHQRLANIQAVKTRLLNQGGVLSVSFMDRFPSNQNRSISTIKTKDAQDQDGTIMQSMEVDEDFIPTMGLELINGRNFEVGRASDEHAVLINQTAVRKLGFENPLGQTIFRSGQDYRIIGVLRDWNTNSIHSPIYPIVIFKANDTGGEFLVRISGERNQDVFAGIREIWNALLPGSIFDAAYAEDLHLRAYEDERRLSSLLISFCEFTVFVACLGIFGLAAYSTEQRTKEIGIRKVLGARVTAIVMLLSKNYVRWVLVANIFAWPLAFFVVKKWLQDFAYRTQVGVYPFLSAAFLALVVALFSVIFQTVKAALANPVHSLRHE
ncbi:MAG: ABC transporter permease [Candidatus Aminicenantes bacterium]|nr:ABC transporter permease [Candidatus Aminicenantes bacterium]